jgi:tellurite resistance protein TehA-like permease
MATGIVSIVVHSDGYETLSRALLAITAAGWVLLGAVFLGQLFLDRAVWLQEARRPRSLTAVAGTAVLGSRLTLLGWSWAGWALLASATIWCLVLLLWLASARSLPGTGASFLVVVAPQSVAVLAASLGEHLLIAWPALAALAPFALGLAAYPIALTRFDFRQLRIGTGDQWVAGGALAISTLACAQIAEATVATRALAAVHEPLRVASIVLWVLTIAWLPALVGAELRWPRPRYEIGRWATVFPLGMYAAMSVAVGIAAGVGPFVTLGKGWAWVALVAWIGVTVGMAGRTAWTVRDRWTPTASSDPSQ